MCTLFANLSVLSSWAPHMVYMVPHMVYMGSPYGLHGVPIYILYLYDLMWLVGTDLRVDHTYDWTGRS